MRQIPSILWWFIALLISTQVHAEELLDKVRDSGRLVVGVKVDYPPWGMLNDSGGNSGFEADLAQQIAEAIGQDSDEVAVEFKTVSSANRFRKLNDKDVDILIATVGDTIQRRHQVNMVQPHYFKSGVQVLMKKNSPVYQWSDLIGQPVCLTAGAYFNKVLVQSYRINPVIMMSNRDAELALLTNKCVAWAYDSGILFHLANQPEWHAYQLGLETILPVYWSIVTRNDKESISLNHWLSHYLQTYIRSGGLVDLANKWQLPEREYLLAQRSKWLEKDEQGRWHCDVGQVRTAENRDCLPEPLEFTSIQYSSFWPFDNFDTQRLIQSLLNTAFFTLFAVILAQGLAILFSFLTLKSPWGLGHVVAFVTSVQSSIPPILMLYLVYFGALPYLIAPDKTHLFSGGAVSLIILSLYTAAGINNLVSAGYPAKSSLLNLYLQHQVGVRANLVNLAKAAGIASVLASPNAVLVINSLVSGSGYPLLLMTLLALFYYTEVMLFAALINYVVHRLEDYLSPDSEDILQLTQEDA